MKHQEVFDLAQKLRKVKGLEGRDLNYEIQYNLNEIDRLSAPLITQEKEIEEILKKYNEEKKEVFKKNSTTADGTVKTKKLQISETEFFESYEVQEEKKEEHDKEIVALDKKHKKEITDYDVKRKDFLEFLKKTESKFVVSKVKMHHVPENISTEMMNLIFDIIEKKVAKA